MNWAVRESLHVGSLENTVHLSAIRSVYTAQFVSCSLDFKNLSLTVVFLTHILIGPTVHRMINVQSTEQ